MVQLKGYKNTTPSDTPLISIPDGSIKRARNVQEDIRQTGFQFQMVQLKDVVVVLIRFLWLFQFQMVQLKGLTTKFSRHTQSISIPDGSIKSLTQMADELETE